MSQNRGKNGLACFSVFFSFVLCFFPVTAIPADDTGSGMATSKNVPQKGFYFDEQSSTLFCNGKPVGRVASASVRENFRLHPYPKFLSYNAGDRVTLFYEGEISWQQIWSFSQSENILHQSFSVISPFLAHDGTQSYYVSRDRTGPLPDAPYLVFSFLPLAGNPPVETLVVMPDQRYLKSKNSVYYYGWPIKGADPNTFITLSHSHPSITNRVYNLSMEDFEYIEEYEGMAFDSQHVYLGGQIVKEIAAGTDLKLLCRYLVVSERGVYYVRLTKLEEITGADPPTMQMLGTYYSRDNDQIFFDNKKIAADPESFQVIEGYYAKDRDKVYYGGSSIPGADPRTFVSIGRGYAKDKRHAYLKGGVIEKAESDGFELYPLSAEYRRAFKHQYHITEEDFYFAHDRKRVFVADKIIGWGDPKSFRPEKYYAEYRASEQRRLDDLYRKGKIVY